MTVLTVELPVMYGDHHVIEVRRLLLDLDGVDDVYASSAFRVAEITYNAKKITKKDILARLEEAGYLGELSVPAESAIPVNESDGQGDFFRHTTAYAQRGGVVGFGQEVAYQGRQLWPCPGIGLIRSMEEE